MAQSAEQAADDTEGANGEYGVLPVVYGALYGHHDDLVRAEAAIAAGLRPVLTVVGPGDVSKTRLAIALGERLAVGFADGTRFVALAGERTASDAEARIRRALGVAGSIRAWLESREVLLILDNLEQISGVSELVLGILPRAGRSRLVTTSRGPLHLAAEQVLRLEPLRSERRRHDAGGGRGPAVALFVEAARAADAVYAPDGAELDAIGELCRRLDGLPLAIHLAARRRRLLDVTEMLRRIETDPTLLSGEGGDLEERQRTVERSIGWSLDLLTDDERMDAHLLALAPSGWSEPLLAAVEPAITLGTLERLLDLGIIGRESDRLAMLQTVRDAVLTSVSRHRTPDGSGLRLVEAVARFSETIAGRGPEPTILANDATFQQAILLCRELDEPTVLLRIVAHLHRYWVDSGTAASIAVPLRWALMRAELHHPSDHLRAQAVGCLASALAGDPEADLALAASMVAYADEWGSIHERARNVLGGAMMMAGRYEDAYDSFTFALTLEGEGADVSTVRLNLAGVSMALDRDGEAHAHLVAALRRSAGSTDLDGHPVLLMHMVELATRAGDLPSARAHLRAAIHRAIATHQRLWQVGAVYLTGRLALAAGDGEGAAAIVARTEGLMEREGINSSIMIDEQGEALFDGLRRRIGPVEWQSLRESSRDESLPGLVSDALSWLERPVASSTGPLTAREGEIAMLIAAGRTNHEIAGQLYLSPRTVQTHVANMLRKLGLPSRSAPAAWQATVTAGAARESYRRPTHLAQLARRARLTHPSGWCARGAAPGIVTGDIGRSPQPSPGVPPC